MYRFPNTGSVIDQVPRDPGGSCALTPTAGWVPGLHLTRDSRCPRQDAGRKSRQVGFWRQETPLLASSDFRTPCRRCLAPPRLPQSRYSTSPCFPLTEVKLASHPSRPPALPAPSPDLPRAFSLTKCLHIESSLGICFWEDLACCPSIKLG